MDYHLSPVGSSPPSYDEYSPPNSQGRSLTEPTTTDQKFKRRRLDLDSNPHSLPDPMHLMNAPVYPPGPRTYMTGSYMPPTTNFGHYASSPPAYWDEEAALEYLASGNGFVQDVRLVVAPTPSVHYQPQHHPTSASQPPATEATPHHPGSSQLRHASNIPAPATNLRPPVLESYQQIPNHPWPAAHSTHYAPGTDASSFANDPRELSRLMNLTASLRPPSHAFCPIEATSSTANQIKLVLSRATQESIDALPEHKRECPACQLDFERDNFMAIISCCNTAMHATCLSAWVNSATYAKSKTCMKCRRAIDARRPLNAVVPPVNDQIWDEGVDLDAPEAIKGDQKIEVLVNPRADRGRRYMRNAYAHYRSTSIQIPENMPPGPRRQLAHLQQEQASEFDGVRRRLRGMMANGNRLTKEESLARRGLAEAQVDVRQGGSSNLEALNQKCEAIKRQKDQWCQDVRSLQRVLEGLPRNHERRVAALIENAMFPRPAEANAATLGPAATELHQSGSMSYSP